MQAPASFLFLLRRPAALAVLVVLGFAARVRADDPTPHPLPANRYDMMAVRSPFAPPTEAIKPPPTATSPPVPSWSDKFSVSMLMQDHGIFYATVVDADNPQHLYLNSAREDPISHLKIGPVQWNPSGGQEQPMVTLLRGSERAQVRYEPGSGAGAAILPPRPPGAPGISAPNLFRPPPIQPASGAVNPPPTSTVLRRAPIRAVPPPPAAGGAGRTVVLPGEGRAAPPTRTAPQPIKTDDDDDDD